MKILFIFTITIWIIVALLIMLFSKKYHIVNAICVKGDSCENLNKTPGFIYFEYKNDFGRGMNTYYGQATTTGIIKEGKQCKILITKDYNERVIVYADVIKLIIVLVLLSVLLLLLYVSGIDVFEYVRNLKLF